MSRIYKTFYRVEYRILGTEFTSTQWFDNKEDAKAFSNQDYHDDPIPHRASKAERVADYENKCAETRFFLENESARQ